MATNLKGDRYSTMAAEITDGVDIHQLHAHQRANLDDAIAARLRYEIEGAADQRTSVTESLLAAERKNKEEFQRDWLEACEDAYKWEKRAVLADAALKAIRADLDTHHRDPGYCDLAWLVTRVQMHIGYKPEEQSDE